MSYAHRAAIMMADRATVSGRKADPLEGWSDRSAVIRALDDALDNTEECRRFPNSKGWLGLALISGCGLEGPNEGQMQAALAGLPPNALSVLNAALAEPASSRRYERSPGWLGAALIDGCGITSGPWQLEGTKRAKAWLILHRLEGAGYLTRGHSTKVGPGRRKIRIWKRAAPGHALALHTLHRLESAGYLTQGTATTAKGKKKGRQVPIWTRGKRRLLDLWK